MYGTDSEEEDRRREEEESLVELKPEVVEFNTLHKREEELYFYDTFAYPWEKEKHYKMVYQLEKKYYPDQCLEKAFLEPGESNSGVNGGSDLKGKAKPKKTKDREGDKGLVFFEQAEREEKKERELVKNVSSKDVTEKKVEDFFKCLKKVPNEDAGNGNGEPYLLTRNTELPPRWDGPYGTVVLVNKPKGEAFGFLCPFPFIRFGVKICSCNFSSHLICLFIYRGIIMQFAIQDGLLLQFAESCVAW